MHPWKNFVLALLPAVAHNVLAQNVIDLSGDGWTVSSKALNISVPGNLPSQAHLDLYAAGVIGESNISQIILLNANSVIR